MESLPLKKIIISAVILLFLVALIVFIYPLQPKDRLTNGGENPGVPNILSPREQTIKDYLAGIKKFEKLSFGGKEFSVVVYNDSEGVWDKDRETEMHNHADFPYDRAGIILFDGKEIFWESTEPFSKIFPETVYLIDLNNDGVNEIYAVDLIGEKLTGCSIYAYELLNDGAKLITPYREVEGADPRDRIKLYKGRVTELEECEPSLSQNGLVDLDGDKTFEIMTREYGTDNFIQAYKWDGVEYKAWRELEIGSEIGLGEYKGSANDFLRDSREIDV